MMIWQLRRLLEAHGANSDHWPPDKRVAAVKLLLKSRKAQALLAEAKSLDAAMRAGAMMETPFDENLAARIVERATALPQDRLAARATDEAPFKLSLRWLLPQAAGLAAAGIIGFAVGFSGLLPGNGDDGTVDLSDMAFGANLDEDLL